MKESEIAICCVCCYCVGGWLGCESISLRLIVGIVPGTSRATVMVIVRWNFCSDLNRATPGFGFGRLNSQVFSL